MINREHIIGPIRPFYEITDLVKVLIGIRRSGKSVLLSQIAAELLEKGIDNDHIIVINFELLDFADLKTAKSLHNYVVSHVKPNETYFVFLDEIQLVEEFELAVNSLRARGNISVFITGSNAHLLSGELATYLSGRYVQFPVTPFSFAETLLITGETDKKIAFDTYMKWGGMPGRFAFKTETETQKYLQDVFDTIILRDIVIRKKIRDINLLNNIIQFLLENSGNIFSANTVAKYLKSQSRSVSAETLYNYIEYIIESLLFTKVNRFDVKGKNVFATLEKYYIADMGLLQLKRGMIDEHLGGRLESIVANELLARGYKINVGVLRNAEIDFIAGKNNETEYIQVCYHIDSDETMRREINAFDGIPEKKLLITTDNFDYSQKGVKSVNVIDWLLDRK
ncbi:MAG: ATP-binding protein [Dysgonamonadaceae bacterium]|jgi:predicted AAA+ superfamily ATPase|nr:ATP-binding protein [Dysgonamonadaceae bacterium]